jgi:23S rRNA (adenine2030-N6)-methyltransferase
VDPPTIAQYAALLLLSDIPLLSYRHSFHAGNLADVLKHSILTAVLEAAVTKPTPLVYLDTHAGAGIYQFDDGTDARAEHRFGIDALRGAAVQAAPHSIARYLDCVGSLNAGPTTLCYPGSAVIAAQLLRDTDRLLLCERHPADAAALAHTLRADPRVRIEFGDGYAQLKSALPPLERRGVILIDPAYELADEPIQVIDGLRAALSRFRHGVYLVWYPLHGKHDHTTLKRHFRRLDPPKTLCVELDPTPPAPAGATGSGVLVVNPPFQAVAELEALTAFLGRTLTPGARAICEWLIPE